MRDHLQRRRDFAHYDATDDEEQSAQHGFSPATLAVQIRGQPKPFQFTKQ